MVTYLVNSIFFIYIQIPNLHHKKWNDYYHTGLSLDDYMQNMQIVRNKANYLQFLFL